MHKDIDHSDCQRQRSLTGPNIWPAALQPHFEACMMTYFHSIRQVSFLLMELLAKTLDIDFEEHFSTFCEDSLQAIRLLHYPPQSHSADEKQLGTGAHTDFGAVTCLLTDGTPGLQVHKDGLWVNVDCEPGDYVSLNTFYRSI
jgi:isopenicillin N synthase-like dioxygenase